MAGWAGWFVLAKIWHGQAKVLPDSSFRMYLPPAHSPPCPSLPPRTTLPHPITHRHARPPRPATHPQDLGSGRSLTINARPHEMPLWGRHRVARECAKDIPTPCAVATWRPRMEVSDSIAAGTSGASGERRLRHRRAAEQARTYLALDIQSSIGKSDKVVEQVVGPVGESRRDHLKRCQQPGCPRCRWYRVRHRWQATYGSLEADAGPRGKIIWLSERPARWGGAWALGCSLCAAALARRQDIAGTQKPKNAGEANQSVPIAPGLGMRPGLHSCRLSM